MTVFDQVGGRPSTRGVGNGSSYIGSVAGGQRADGLAGRVRYCDYWFTGGL